MTERVKVQKLFLGFVSQHLYDIKNIPQFLWIQDIRWML